MMLLVMLPEVEEEGPHTVGDIGAGHKVIVTTPCISSMWFHRKLSLSVAI